MGNFSAWELIIIAILVFVIFGGRKLPELGRGLGKALVNFRQEIKKPEATSGEESAKPAPQTLNEPETASAAAEAEEKTGDSPGAH